MAGYSSAVVMVGFWELLLCEGLVVEKVVCRFVVVVDKMVRRK